LASVSNTLAQAFFGNFKLWPPPKKQTYFAGQLSCIRAGKAIFPAFATYCTAIAALESSLYENLT
jgi:hypothetical protein